RVDRRKHEDVDLFNVVESKLTEKQRNAGSGVCSFPVDVNLSRSPTVQSEPFTNLQSYSRIYCFPIVHTSQPQHYDLQLFLLIFSFVVYYYLRTQAMYQMLDQCFNTKTGRVLYTCFQSVQAQKGSEYERVEIRSTSSPRDAIGKVCLESAVELPRILCQEEQDTYRKIHSLAHLDPQMSAVSGPLLQWLEDRLEQNRQSIVDLQREKERLERELAAL
uniref:BRCA1/BRCA2-containing complex, subunit 3 n=1 Tax=Salarias fasciatus TaxID=181472 RepID=A0A672FD91_SALFA